MWSVKKSTKRKNCRFCVEKTKLHVYVVLGKVARVRFRTIRHESLTKKRTVRIVLKPMPFLWRVSTFGIVDADTRSLKAMEAQSRSECNEKLISKKKSTSLCIAIVTSSAIS